MPTPSRRDDVVGAIAVIVLLIGTATGSAYVILGMSVTAIILLGLFYRQHIGTGAILAAFVAAVTAAVIAIVLLMATDSVSSQQVADLKYKPPIPRPAYEAGSGPRVAIDEAHHNFHTAEGRYKPFAELLRRDGYRVNALGQLFSAESLKSVDILVISNALNERNAEDWSPPNPSAFTPEEIDTVHRWVEQGGSLFLIADHLPFPGAASDLAKSFGVEFCNGYATAGPWKSGGPETFEYQTGLKESTITRGRSDEEKITKVMTFTGSAFRPPTGATPVLVFGANSEAEERTDGEPGKPKTRTVPIEGWCQGAVMKVGKGRVAVFGEAAMFSAQLAGPRHPMGMNAPGAEQNHQLLLNVLHWLSRAQGWRTSYRTRSDEEQVFVASHQRRVAEPAVAADRAGISACRGSTSFPPALLLNWVVRPPTDERTKLCQEAETCDAGFSLD